MFVFWYLPGSLLRCLYVLVGLVGLVLFVVTGLVRFAVYCCLAAWLVLLACLLLLFGLFAFIGGLFAFWV